MFPFDRRARKEAQLRVFLLLSLRHWLSILTFYLRTDKEHLVFDLHLKLPLTVYRHSAFDEGIFV